MRTNTKRATAVLAVAIALGGVVPTGAHAADQLTSKECVYDIRMSGGSIKLGVKAAEVSYSTEILATRCAQAKIQYTNSSFRKITGYKIKYTVLDKNGSPDGASWGPAHNENYYKITSGWRTGTQTWVSPDRGNANTWITRKPGTSTTYIGQTTIAIQAVPDIPGTGDPKIAIGISNW